MSGGSAGRQRCSDRGTPVRRGIALTLVTLIASGCTGANSPSGHLTTPDALAAVDGASVTRIQLDGRNVAYLQLIDLSRMQIDQIIGPTDTAASQTSEYYPAAGSPWFRRLTVDQMQSSCRGRYAATAFSAVNFAFFESYAASTALAFPVKVNGRVMTGGSGPYGPVTHPKDPYYRTSVLRALTWTDHGAVITRYDPATGAPLSDPAVRDAVVTYLYTDHPSYALAGDPPNRYQLLGVVETDSSRPLAILTVDRARLQAGAQILRQHGVTGDILTFDGGVSTYLWTSHNGVLETPDNNSHGASALPHYLCIHHR